MQGSPPGCAGTVPPPHSAAPSAAAALFAPIIGYAPPKNQPYQAEGIAFCPCSEYFEKVFKKKLMDDGGPYDP